MKKLLEYIKILLVSVLGMVLVISLLGQMNVIIGPFDLEISLSFFSYGITELEFPPFGRVWATTHNAPLRITALLKNINLDLLRETISELPEKQYMAELLTETRKAIVDFALRLLLLGFIGGAAAIYFIFSKNVKKVLLGGVTGLLILALLFFSIYISYDPQAFISPEFEGALTAAPWVFGLIEETLIKVATLGEQLEIITSNLYLLFERLQFLEPLGLVDGEKKILHVSDIHNNPAAFDFIEQVIANFNVDFVIDTGDITDFGTPLEAELASRVGELGIPYIFVPGNHDSPNTIAVLAELSGVKVVEKGVAEVEGILVAGIQDPSSFSSAMIIPSNEILDSFAVELKSFLFKENITPHIIAIHHPRIAEAFVDDIPIILTGHTHSLHIEETAKSVIINAGSTGAAGIRGLNVAREIPFSLVLLHLNRDEENQWKLTAADTIKVFQFQSGFSLSRILFTKF